MKHILIIDDDADVRKSIEFVLMSFGFSTSIAADGRQALRRCAEREPDLVITDIVMPEMEGIETILTLRKRYAGLPIIAMSGSLRTGPADYLGMASKLGATETLPKPFSADELLRTIDRCRLAPTSPDAPMYDRQC